MINLIVCKDRKNAIGKNNELPWHLPKDLAYFKRITEGHIVVMGRNTYESIGKPLPNRINVVLSKTMKETDNIVVTDDIDKVLKTAKESQFLDTFIIGGSSIYEQFLPYADRLYITNVHTVIEGADAYFPMVDFSEWKELRRTHEVDNGYDLIFEVYDRAK
jgi:dihydrofolate reductase